MLYTALIYHDEDARAQQTPAAEKRAVAAHRQVQARARAAGAFVLATRLDAPANATIHLGGAGDIEVMDGPFIETKELLVGFYIFDCADAAEARSYADMLARTDKVTVELRPIAWMGRAKPAKAG